jgi:hypothetical protein
MHRLVRADVNIGPELNRIVVGMRRDRGKYGCKKAKGKPRLGHDRRLSGMEYALAPEQVPLRA